ncbi:MAG TPA: BamA/TamA family outer membrane protein [Flavisolibacter sp.]|nr:BamA/TamA family outer membrane protein [Flavisolibacter sp.]
MLIVIAAVLLLAGSCTTVKNFPQGRPFVYETNIDIQGKYSTDEKKTLRSQLEQQLHDSIRVRRQQKFLFWQSIKNPPAYDTLNAAKSKLFMSALLNSLGYYRDSISVSDSVTVEDGQQRTTVNFTVIPGKIFTLDSVWYNLLDSVPYSPDIDTLQKITMASMEGRLLKKGDPFSKPLISSELDRLSDVYRNNGYLRFSKEQLLAVWDTVGIAALRPTFDPIELARQLEEQRKRRENPTADLQIRLRPNPDSLRLNRYYVGTVRVYPDFNSDTAFYEPTITRVGTSTPIEVISYQGLFKPTKLIRYVHLKRGQLYRQSDFLKTQNRFNSLGAWRLVTVTQLPRPGADTVDFEIRLTPAKKMSTSINFDVSLNQGNIATQSSLIGLGSTFTLLNRNFAKSAALATWNLRYGVELTSKIDSIQTQQWTLGHTIQFPRLVPRLLFLKSPAMLEYGKTFLGFNLGLTDRIDYFRVITLNTSWGYEFSWRNKLLSIRVPNIEYNYLQRRFLLDSLIKENASYRYIFSDGLIASLAGNLTIAGGRKDLTKLTRISAELSNPFTGLIYQPRNKENKLYRFVKIDAEHSQTYKIRRTAIAWRLFAGLGYGLPFSLRSGETDSSNFYMPFFRQYYAGGPNSMRAWAVRKLGPGSSVKSYARNIAPDRFGDMRLELNAEYRFYLTNLFGFPLEGALYTDMGNVWFIRRNADFPNGEFRLSRLWKDIAIGAGTGLRIDFGLLKLRLDYAYKVKDPSPDENAASRQNKLFYNWKPLNGQFQLGIDYPF